MKIRSTSKTVTRLMLAATTLGLAATSQAATNYEPYTITTLAGSTASGSADGTGSAAQFNIPFDVAVDGSGNIYVADTQNSTIRKVTQAGVVTTFAGTARQTGSSDGQGGAARFSNPGGIAADSAGNLYVADNNNYTIRKITPDGAVTTLAGSAGQSGSADGKGSAARFSYLGKLAVDSSGNVIVADYANQTIRKIAPDGTVTTIAGAVGLQGGADGPAAQARFMYPKGVAVDSNGNIYISDEQNNTIRKLSNGTVSTLAGTPGGNPGGGSNDGTGSAAQFNFPEGVAVDKAGNVYVSDSNNALIRKVTPAGVVTTLAGVPNTQSTSDGTGKDALFETPEGIAVDAAGTVYITDCFGNNALRVGKPAGSGQPAGFANISARGLISRLQGNSEEEAGTLVDEFIISGSTSQLTMLFRGLGPELASSGITNALQDPTLVLSESNTGTIRWQNDNWKTGDNSTYPSQQSDIQSTGIAPSDDRESAFLVNLEPGQYAVTERGTAGGTGVGLAEGYLISGKNSFIPTAGSRGQVTADTPLSVGVNIPGSGGQVPVLIRALGPSLKTRGVAGSFLQDPYLTVVNNSGTKVATSDSWQENTAAVNTAQKNFSSSLDPVEPAVVQMLAPGNYIASVTGNNPDPNVAKTRNPAGVAFAQFYQLDSNGVAISSELNPEPATPNPYPPGSTSGLSATVLTVNGSTSVSSLTPDYPIVFEATQSDTKDVVQVRVQWTTVATSWTDLNTGFSGRMTFNSNDNKYVLTTENYPIGNGIFFRAIASSPGKPDSISAPVGGPNGFNITSSKTHLPPTLFQIEGMRQQFLVFIAAYPLDFQASIQSQVNGLSVRLQSTKTPQVETSWTDVSGDQLNNVGTDSAGNTNFDLRAGNYPASSGTQADTYFRVVASASGYADSISNFVGPFYLQQNQPPTVTITSPTGTGTESNPLQVSLADAQHFLFSATGSDPDGSVKSVELYEDDALVTVNDQGSSDPNTARAIFTFTPGKHTLTAVVKDNLDAYSYKQVVIQVAPPAQAKSYVLSQSGDWNNASNWTPNGVPGPLDSADVGNNTVSVGSGAHITVATLSGGNLSGADQSSKVTVTKSFHWTGGTIANCTLEIASGAQGEIKAVSGGNDFNLNAAAIVNDAGGKIGVDVDSFINSSASFHGKTTGSSLNNAGTINFNSKTLADQTANPFLTAIISQQATKKLQGLGSITNTGKVYLNGVVLDLSATSSGNSHLRAASAPAGFIQMGGVLDFGPLNQAGTIIGNVVVNGGTITGNGAIIGDLTNTAGLIAPGHSGGVLSVVGNFTQAKDGTLLLEVGGTNANGPDYDQLQVAGTANLGGTLDVKTISAFTPQSTDTFAPLSFGSATGNFASVTSNAALTINSTGAVMSVTGANPAAAQLLNISTRMEVLGSDNVLISGFIITGPAGSSKKVMIRGIGPSLTKNGITNPLTDPFLELHNPDGSTVTNDNWQDAPNSSDIPNGFQPGDPRESVIIATLGPGAYTAILHGAHGETGIGLAEAYDLDATTGQCANISTRGYVDTGDNVMIGGFIVGGGVPSNVLVRAIGPSLADQGVQGALPGTVLEVHDQNGAVLSNQGWRSTQSAEITATTIAPKNDLDSAVLATLVPGPYTAIVRGVNDATGVGLVEAYNLQ